jgi:hypothetical protein
MGEPRVDDEIDPAPLHAMRLNAATEVGIPDVG